jgi:hypothetical protein
MDSEYLQPWQARRVHRALQPHLKYLYRLRARMEKVGFPPSDPLFQTVNRAYDSAHALYIQLHYLSCKSGTGKPSK